MKDLIKTEFDTGLIHPAWPYINFILFILSFILGIAAFIMEVL